MRALGLVLAFGCLGWPWVAPAATLIEAEVTGRPVTFLIDSTQDLVLVTVGDQRIRVDLVSWEVELATAGEARRTHIARAAPLHQLQPYEIQRYGPGPMIAGHVGSYYVLSIDDQVCAELLLVEWMTPFIHPATRALALLDRLRPPDERPCAAVPFAIAAAGGWPLMAGKIDQPALETTKVTFAYQPPPAALAPATTAAEISPAEMAEYLPELRF